MRPLKAAASQNPEGLNVRIRRRRWKFIRRIRTAEPLQITTCMRVGWKPGVEYKRSCALDATTNETVLCKKKGSSVLEGILDRRNIEKALEQVMRNRGSGGVDGMSTDELHGYLHTNWQRLRTKILEGRNTQTASGKENVGYPDSIGQAASTSHKPDTDTNIRGSIFHPQLRFSPKQKCTSSCSASAELFE